MQRLISLIVLILFCLVVLAACSKMKISQDPFLAPVTQPGMVTLVYVDRPEVAKLCGDPNQFDGCYMEKKHIIVTRLPEADDPDYATIITHEIHHSQGLEHAEHNPNQNGSVVIHGLGFR